MSFESLDRFRSSGPSAAGFPADVGAEVPAAGPVAGADDDYVELPGAIAPPAMAVTPQPEAQPETGRADLGAMGVIDGATDHNADDAVAVPHAPDATDTAAANAEQRATAEHPLHGTLSEMAGRLEVLAALPTTAPETVQQLQAGLGDLARIIREALGQSPARELDVNAAAGDAPAPPQLDDAGEVRFDLHDVQDATDLAGLDDQVGLDRSLQDAGRPELMPAVELPVELLAPTATITHAENRHVHQQRPVIDDRVIALNSASDPTSVRIDLYAPEHARRGTGAALLLYGVFGTWEDGRMVFDPVLSRMSPDLDVPHLQVQEDELLRFSLPATAAAGLRATLIEQYRARVMQIAHGVSRLQTGNHMGTVGMPAVSQLLQMKMATFDQAARDEIAAVPHAQVWRVPVQLSILASRQYDGDDDEDGYPYFDLNEESTLVMLGEGAVNCGEYGMAGLDPEALGVDALPAATGLATPVTTMAPLSLDAAMRHLVMGSEEAAGAPVYAHVDSWVTVIAGQENDARAIAGQMMASRLFDLLDTRRMVPVDVERFEPQQDRPAPRG